MIWCRTLISTKTSNATIHFWVLSLPFDDTVHTIKYKIGPNWDFTNQIVHHICKTKSFITFTWFNMNPTNKRSWKVGKSWLHVIAYFLILAITKMENLIYGRLSKGSFDCINKFERKSALTWTISRCHQRKCKLYYIKIYVKLAIGLFKGAISEYIWLIEIIYVAINDK